MNKLEQKERITLWLGKDVIAHFKQIAHDDGDRPYQPLINKVLQDYLQSLNKPTDQS